MAKFVSREKLSKKARKELDNQKRTVWAFSPTTKKVESKKLYNRKKSARAWKNDFGMSGFCLLLLWHTYQNYRSSNTHFILQATHFQLCFPN